MVKFEISPLFSVVIVFNALMLCLFKPPILMLISVISQALMICLMLKTMMKSSWFSFILFLIFIGGLMILFIYIISLASNNDTTQKNSKLMALMLMIPIMMVLSLNLNLYSPAIYHFYQNNTTVLLNKTYSVASNLTIFSVMVYLLLVLLICVNMLLTKKAPLRSFSKIL